MDSAFLARSISVPARLDSEYNQGTVLLRVNNNAPLLIVAPFQGLVCTPQVSQICLKSIALELIVVL